MPIVHVDGLKESHMRLEFTDEVVSLPLADGTTFQDVALTCRNLTRKRHGELVSLVVILKAQETQSADSGMA